MPSSGGGASSRIGISGDIELKRLLEQLPEPVVKKGLRAAISAGATPIVKGAKRNVERESGLLKRSITKRVKSYKSGNVTAIIGASRQVRGEYKGRPRVPAHYIQLVEKGTRPHSVGKGSSLARVGSKKHTKDVGQDVGRMHPGAAAHPFLGPALQENSAAAVEVASAKLKESVEREAMKLGKR